MTNNRLSEGVGKKIVEALKKQSEIEVNPTSASSQAEEETSFENEAFEGFEAEEQETTNAGMPEDDFFSALSSDDETNVFGASDNDMSAFQPAETNFAAEEPIFVQPSAKKPAANKPFAGTAQPQQSVIDNFSSDLDSFEIPTNIAVLKKLITQLPSGVTRHTGAQIIRQTMEALGISMKSVLQEAQQLQDGLSNSAKECQNTIQEYKKQIITLEKQSQNHQRQYSALNELISLFIQTNNR